ncbi:hypothetical protein EDB84DRAFT_1475045 [Lactarius hengduanensis]|nr:hypothetical protein EDB84DRAFT_1475045 [Lactarius hengduanensis]
MEAKLKSLKVADLRDICTRANVSTTTRSTKADLMAKILASQPAIDAYNAKYQPNGNPPPPPKSTVPPANDDMLASPEDVDWTLQDSPKPVPAPLASPTRNIPNSPAKPPPTPAPTNSQPKASPPKPTPVVSETEAPAPAAAAATSVDDELEKRKARAARFGIALVEPVKPKSAKTASEQTPPKSAGAVADVDPEKLKARSQRFATGKSEQQIGATPATAPAPAAGGKKRRTPVEEVDTEEQERRRKRAERFGIPVVGAKA